MAFGVLRNHAHIAGKFELCTPTGMEQLDSRHGVARPCEPHRRDERIPAAGLLITPAALFTCPLQDQVGSVDDTTMSDESAHRDTAYAPDHLGVIAG